MNATAADLPAARYLLKRTAEGRAELFSDGETIWASDNDPDLLEAINTDAVRDDDIADVLDYLVDAGHLSEEDRDEVIVDSPDDEDEDGELYDEDEDEDEDDEDELD